MHNTEHGLRNAAKRMEEASGDKVGSNTTAKSASGANKKVRHAAEHALEGVGRVAKEAVKAAARRKGSLYPISISFV